MTEIRQYLFLTLNVSGYLRLVIYRGIPLIEEQMRLFFIPSRFDWWVWNYIFHWTFLFEILIIMAASTVLYLKKLKKSIVVT